MDYMTLKEAEKPVDRRRKAAKQLTGEQYD